MNLTRRLVLLFLLSASALVAAEPRAARSVHWGYDAPPAEAFSLEMTIDKSTPGSYFMAAGWNTGYFGLQDLGDKKKVVIFSVWDPTSGDDPGRVDQKDRVECLYQGENVRIKRFGGEGTGGQCMADFKWELGETVRFLVTGKPEGKKTSYSGYIQRADEKTWTHLVTFRTQTGGKPLSGLYSFVEDFRRNGKSVHEVRRASYGNAWVYAKDEWQPITKARFTASSSEWEAQETIDAGLDGERIYLTTGGDTKRSMELNKRLEFPAGKPDAEPTLPPASEVKTLEPATP